MKFSFKSDNARHAQVSFDFSEDGLTRDEYDGLFEFSGEFDDNLTNEGADASASDAFKAVFVYRGFEGVAPEVVAYAIIRDMASQLLNVFAWRIDMLTSK